MKPRPDYATDPDGFVKWNARANARARRRFLNWQAEIGRPVPDKPDLGELDILNVEEG